MSPADQRTHEQGRHVAIQDAIGLVRNRSPFADHMPPHVLSYETVADLVLRTLPPGARLLDFGAGSCDKVAILSALGYQCSAFDDFGDPWYRVDHNLERIRTFARAMQVDLRSPDQGEPWPEQHFDMVMLHAVIEHLHDSPRDLLLQLLSVARPGGYLFITVPSAVNLRKRFDVLRGRTNLPPFRDFFASETPWRGHVREYVRDDLRLLAKALGLDVLELRSYHQLLHKLPTWGVAAYRAATSLVPGGRDSWLLLARKPAGWTPPAIPTP